MVGGLIQAALSGTIQDRRSRCPGVTSLTGSAGAVASPPLCGVEVWINPTESERSYYLSSVVSARRLCLSARQPSLFIIHYAVIRMRAVLIDSNVY